MPRTYQNMIDYVRTQLDTFAQRDVCRVDSLVFSWLVYFRLPEGVAALETGKGVALKDLFRADWFDEMCGPLYDTESSIELLTAVAASPRFRDVWVSGYESLTDERAEQQFAAMTFQLSMRETLPLATSTNAFDPCCSMLPSAPSSDQCSSRPTSA